MDIKDILGRVLLLKNIIRIAVFAVIIILVLLLASFVIDRAAERKYYSSSAMVDEIYDPDLPDFSIDSSDLKIPEKYSKNPEFTWKPYRTPSTRWSSEEIKRFWKDPADVIIEAYEDENRKHIEKILEDVR